MTTINVPVQLQGLNQVLAAMAQLQNVARDIERAAKGLQGSAGGSGSGSGSGPTPPHGSGGSSGSGSGNPNRRSGSQPARDGCNGYSTYKPYVQASIKKLF